MSQIFKSNKRQRTEANPTSFLERITLHPDPQTGLIQFQHFQSIFSKYQIAYIPNVGKLSSVKGGSKFQIGDFADVFNKLIPEDQETWTEETWDIPKEQKSNHEDRKPGTFLDTAAIPLARYHPKRGYCSFIVQNDKEQLERLLGQLPIVHLPISDPTEVEASMEEDENDIGTHQQTKQNIVPMKYGPGIWIFFGWNIGENKNDLQGRGEHTDAIHHGGTFHYQMSGVKDWYVRPTDELLLKRIDVTKDDDGDDELLHVWRKEREQQDDSDQQTATRTKLHIRCSEGDMILINTRLWWHSTTLPSESGTGSSSVTIHHDECKDMESYSPSVSYARDIYIGENNDEVGNPEKQTHLTNVDGLYAANDIEAGTILFRESEMPDCELHRTRSDPNCELVELEDGEGAVISCRDIKAGEFFCILESDDSCSEEDFESDNDDDGDEDDDEEDGGDHDEEEDEGEDYDVDETG